MALRRRTGSILSGVRREGESSAAAGRTAAAGRDRLRPCSSGATASGGAQPGRRSRARRPQHPARIPVQRAAGARAPGLLDDPERELLVADGHGRPGRLHRRARAAPGRGRPVRRGRRPRRRGAAPRRRPRAPPCSPPPRTGRGPAASRACGSAPTSRAWGRTSSTRPSAAAWSRTSASTSTRCEAHRPRRQPRGPARAWTTASPASSTSTRRSTPAAPGAHAPAHRARRRRRPHRLRGAALPHARCWAAPAWRGRLRRLPGLPRAAARGGAARPHRRRLAVLPHRHRARRTTARCCSTGSSAARRSSTRSSGPTTTAAGPARAGRPSTTPSSGTPSTPARYVFRYDDIDRIPYLAPGLVGPEKAARGKTPTDVWWHTIVSPTGKEKTGYPTQKPVKILERIVRVHSDPGDLVVDFFAGSGTTGRGGGAAGPRTTCWWTRTPRRSASCASAWRGTGRRWWTPGPPDGLAGRGRRRRPSRPLNATRGRLLAEPAPRTSRAAESGHSGTIASLGQDSTQVAQSSHFSGSMT